MFQYRLDGKFTKTQSIFEAPRECNCARASMRVEELNELDLMQIAIQNRRNKNKYAHWASATTEFCLPIFLLCVDCADVCVCVSVRACVYANVCCVYVCACVGACVRMHTCVCMRA